MDTAARRTAAVTQGAARLLVALGHAVLREVVLPHGRRADLLALAPDDSFAVVEVKSCARDFLADAKWPEYRAFCDRLFFAVDPDFPHVLLPQDAGVLVADAYGGAVLREAPHHPLAWARRRALLGRFARLAARRLEGLLDPAGLGDATGER
ncbi:DNA repair putative endonuclease MmcB [Elioraea sp.]|uniref:DNA repair putative endonuclease MmcB n=1 Tax=Elioraea sp. TaxID=2185103 RepID=UPI00307DDCE3